MDSLPKVKGLSTEQQSRLDAELTARNLTHIGHMKQRPNEVLAALQFALAVDVQSIYAAYGDAEATAKETARNTASIEKANQDMAVEYLPDPIEGISEHDAGTVTPTAKRGRRAPLNPDKES